MVVGFKTFLHTPVTDQLFVDFLEHNSTTKDIRYPQVMIADMGVWGPRGNRVHAALNFTLTLDEEIDHNLSWLRTTFPNTMIVFLMKQKYYESGIEPWVNPKMEEVVRNDGKAVLLRKNELIM